MLCVQWVIGHLFLFLLSKISISTLEKYNFFISLSTLEVRDQNFKFLFLLSKFKIRISNFSFYSRNSRSESQISLSTLEIWDQNFKFLFLLSNLLFWLLSMPDCQGVKKHCHEQMSQNYYSKCNLASSRVDNLRRRTLLKTHTGDEPFFLSYRTFRPPDFLTV